VPMELWLFWRPPWLIAIFVSRSCRENFGGQYNPFPAISAKLIDQFTCNLLV
jgi:hypothetical protein